MHAGQGDDVLWKGFPGYVTQVLYSNVLHSREDKPAGFELGVCFTTRKELLGLSATSREQEGA